MNPRILLGFLVAAGLSGQDLPSRVGRLSFLYGPVSIRPAGAADFAPASLNFPLSNGDRLTTGLDAQAEIHVAATAVHLAPQTDLAIVALDERVLRIRLSVGALNIRIPRMNDGDTVVVETPRGVFRLLRTGDYRLDASPDAAFASVTVRSGTAEGIAGSRPFAVAAGQRLVLSGDPVTADLLEAPAPDPWDDWCSSRDEVAERSLEISEPYVSWDMAGAEDLAPYGDWETDASYGACWIPRGLPFGWAPYRNGHWIYKAPWGWTWVDSAPWGFAPTHFGRWTRFNAAWAWVPGARGTQAKYAPAWVAFSGIAGARHVGWLPLAPGEDARTKSFRNQDAVTVAPLADFAASRPIAPVRGTVLDRGAATFTPKPPEIAPAPPSKSPQPAPAMREVRNTAVEAPVERTPTQRGQGVTPIVPDLRQQQAEQRRAEDQRAADGRRQDAARAEEQRQADESRRAAESRHAEEQRQAEESRRDDESRRADEQRRVDQQRQAEAQRQADDSRRADEQRRADESRRAEEQRQAEESRRASESRHAEEQRRADDSRRADEQRRAEESRRADQQRQAEAQRQADQQHQADESRRAEESRHAEEARRADEQRKADDQKKADDARKK
jgi:hypothetical protein